MSTTAWLILGSIAYATLGFTLGGLQVGAAGYDPANMSEAIRKGPGRYVLLNIFFWPAIYFFVWPFRRFSSYVKLFLIWLASVGCQIKIMDWLFDAIGLWSLLVGVLGCLILQLILVGLLRVPGCFQERTRF